MRNTKASKKCCQAGLVATKPSSIQGLSSLKCPQGFYRGPLRKFPTWECVQSIATASQNLLVQNWILTCKHKRYMFPIRSQKLDPARICALQPRTSLRAAILEQGYLLGLR